MYFSVHVMAHLSSRFLICKNGFKKGWFPWQHLYLFSPKIPDALVEAYLGHGVVDLGEFPELAILLRTHITLNWLENNCNHGQFTFFAFIFRYEHYFFYFFCWSKKWHSNQTFMVTCKTDELWMCVVITELKSIWKLKQNLMHRDKIIGFLSLLFGNYRKIPSDFLVWV